MIKENYGVYISNHDHLYIKQDNKNSQLIYACKQTTPVND